MITFALKVDKTNVFLPFMIVHAAASSGEAAPRPPPGLGSRWPSMLLTAPQSVVTKAC